MNALIHSFVASSFRASSFEFPVPSMLARGKRCHPLDDNHYLSTTSLPQFNRRSHLLQTPHEASDSRARGTVLRNKVVGSLNHGSFFRQLTSS